MEFLELTQKRFSVRDYTNEPVSEEKLQYILECARMAPSAVNFQPWHFYVCQTPEAVEKAKQCYNREWIKTAPAIIIACICHDEEWVRKSDDKPHGNIDIAIVTEHICLAATEQGLGTCWVCNFDTSLCRQLFNLPENEEPAVLIPLGTPTDSTPTEKKRKDINTIVSRL